MSAVRPDLPLFRAIVLGAALLPAALAAAAVDFAREIFPILQRSCFECHDAKLQKGKLRLDSRDGWAKGGESGPAIVPGKPDDSLLIKGVRHWDKEFKMPPEKPLTPPQVADLVQWVKLGAPDPRTNAPALVATTAAKPAYGVSVEEGRKHWAYQPVKAQPLPKLKDKTWPRNDVDFFTFARMEKAGVTPAPDADPRTLIRRLTFDLTGLPPTPEETEAFVHACSPIGNRQSAIGNAVDRLLASPHYGERWGRHWLDVARYADTSGNASDYPVPQAHKYRDYVIAAFNADKPYDQFVRAQIAGDLLSNDRDIAIATGFFAVGPTYISDGGDPEATAQARAETLADRVDTFSRTFLGLTVACARCHDHKFDAITMRSVRSRSTGLAADA